MTPFGSAFELLWVPGTVVDVVEVDVDAVVDLAVAVGPALPTRMSLKGAIKIERLSLKATYKQYTPSPNNKNTNALIPTHSTSLNVMIHE